MVILLVTIINKYVMRLFDYTSDFIRASNHAVV